MELDKKTTKKILLIITFSILIFLGIQNINYVAKTISALFKIIFPFILGGCIAFVLNVPMRALEKKMFKKGKRGKGFRRPLALILTILLFLGVLTLAIFVIAPGIVDAVKNITAALPGAFQRLQQWSVELEKYLPQLEDSINSLNLNWDDISQKAVNMIKTFGTSLLTASGGIIGSVVSGLGTFLIAFVFSIYVLLQKEKLASHIRQIAYGLLSEKHADRFFEIVALADKTFSSFLSGQCLEACILGSLFVISMTIFRMPYALLVGVLIAITALIPIIGAFIGCIVGALLIAITSPIQALIFVIMFLILQQIEGNLIYPHVVGNSVGLPSIWVLAAVTLGGQLMGVVGILLFIPLCSVCYALFKNFIKDRLHKKGVPENKYIQGTDEVNSTPVDNSQNNQQPEKEKK